MTYKEKVRFLEQYQSNLSRQRMLEEEIEQLRSEATRMTAVLSGMPGAKGGAQDRIPRAVERIVGSALPAELVDGDNVGPDRTAVQLAAGDCVVLLSDGVAGPEEDGWVRDLLAAFDGTSPKDLAQAIMEESERRVGAADDRTAVVITLKKRE